MKNGWTGGQYSLFRTVLAMCLLVHFLLLLIGRMDPLVLLGIGLCALFGIGLYDRIAALGLACICFYLFVRVPHRDNLLLGWPLLAHLLLPPAPYGSWAARGRVDPGGGWRMPATIFAATWIVLAVGYGYSGYTKLVNPRWHTGMGVALVSELAFAPLALLPRVRPWLWALMLFVYWPLIALIDFADWNFGLLMIHLLAFDPGWIRPLSAGTELLFYDGHCGLCQRSVRLILAEDATGAAFRFAPLQGETFTALVSPKERGELPLSLVVRTEKGTLLTRSAGVLHILRRLGGLWRILAGLLLLLPTVLRDRLYDGVARIRHRIFAPPAELCPLMPPHLRTRFDP